MKCVLVQTVKNRWFSLLFPTQPKICLPGGNLGAFCILLSHFPSWFLSLSFSSHCFSQHIKAHTHTHSYCNHLWSFISVFHMLLLCVKWQEVTGTHKGMSRMWEKAEAWCERARLVQGTGTFRLKIMPDELCPPPRPWEAGSVAPY